MTDTTLCRLFRCKHCGMPMLLPLDTLLQQIVYPGTQASHAGGIAVLCHHCKHVRTYSLQPDSSDRFGEDRMVPRNRTELVSRLEWLKCEEETCEAHLPLLETWNLTTTLEKRETNAQGQIWDDLHCLNGHPIHFPQIR